MKIKLVALSFLTILSFAPKANAWGLKDIKNSIAQKAAQARDFIGNNKTVIAGIGCSVATLAALAYCDRKYETNILDDIEKTLDCCLGVAKGLNVLSTLIDFSERMC